MSNSPNRDSSGLNPRHSQASQREGAQHDPTVNVVAPVESPRTWLGGNSNETLHNTTADSGRDPTALAGQILVGRHFGRYRIEKELGRGAMGVVYLAHDTNLDRRVALKVPSFSAKDGPDVVDRFYREARAMATITHPNLCPVYDVGEIDGLHYLTMQFVNGRPMSDYLQEGKSYAPKQAAAVLRKIALALEEAHHAGIVHRDLKPSNIMISERHEPMIMDFGLAQRRKENETTLTHSGQLMGTPAYMSPEQVRGNQELTGPPSDVYALGVICFQLLTGTLPFLGSIGEVMAGILTADAQWPADIDSSKVDLTIQAICFKAMSKNIEDRYASAAEFADALKDYMGGNRLLDDEGLPAPTDSSPVSQPAGSVYTSDDEAQLADDFFADLTPAEKLMAVSTPMEHLPRAKKKQKKRPSRGRSRSKQKTNPRRLWIAGGIGVVAVLVLTVVAVLVSNKGAEPNDPVAVKNDDEVNPVGEPRRPAVLDEVEVLSKRAREAIPDRLLDAIADCDAALNMLDQPDLSNATVFREERETLHQEITKYREMAIRLFKDKLAEIAGDVDRGQLWLSAKKFDEARQASANARKKLLAIGEPTTVPEVFDGWSRWSAMAAKLDDQIAAQDPSGTLSQVAELLREGQAKLDDDPAAVRRLCAELDAKLKELESALDDSLQPRWGQLTNEVLSLKQRALENFIATHIAAGLDALTDDRNAAMTSGLESLAAIVELDGLLGDAPADRQRVKDYRLQTYLLKARAYDGDEKNMQDAIDDLEKSQAILPATFVSATSEQRPLWALAATLDAVFTWKRNLGDYAAVLPRLAQARIALDGMGDRPSDPWAPNESERRELENTIDDVAASIDGYLKTLEPHDVVSHSTAVLDLRPEATRLAELKSDALLMLGMYQESAETLRRSLEYVTKAEDRKRIGERIELNENLQVVHHLPDRPDRQVILKTAVERIDKHLPRMPDLVLFDYATQLVAYADNNDKLAADIENPLKKLESEFKRREVENFKQIQEQVAALVKVTPPPPPLAAEIEKAMQLDKPDFERISENLKSVAKKDALLELCQIECELETRDTPLDSQESIDTRTRLERALSRVEPQYQPYANYVQGRLLAATSSSLNEAGEKLYAAFERPDTRFTASVHRRAMAGELLVAAATGMRETVGNEPFPALAGGDFNPFGDAQSADKAHRYFDQAAILLGPKFPNNVRMDVALAAYYGSEKSRSAAEKLSPQEVNGLTPDRANIPTLWMVVESIKDNKLRRDEALRIYANLSALATTESTITSRDVPPLDLYNRILKPALSLLPATPNSLALPDDAQRKLVAKLYGEKASLIRDHPYEKWKFDGSVENEIAGAYFAALTYDDQNPDFHVDFGTAYLAAIKKSQPIQLGCTAVQGDGLAEQYQEILEHAQAAIRIDEKNVGGQALQGRMLIELSRLQTGPLERVRLLRQAETVSTAAIELARENADVKNQSYALTGRSAARLEIANHSACMEQTERARLLRDAAEDARLATELDVAYRDFAFLAYGNALEDLAWIVRENPEENYTAAIGAFGKAVEAYRLNPVSHMARGRCRYKAVAFGNMDKTLLEDAKQDLEQALALKPQTATFAEVYYWLGSLHYVAAGKAAASEREKELGLAERNLKESLALDAGCHAAASQLARVYSFARNSDEMHRAYADAVQRAVATKSLSQFAYLVEWAGRVHPASLSQQPNAVKLMTASLEKVDDPRCAEALYFAGILKEGTDVSGAIEQYGKALLAKPANGCDWDSPLNASLRQTLFVRRNDARVNQVRGKPDLIKTYGAQLIQDAEEAVKLINENTSTTTSATLYGNAGMSHLLVVTGISGDTTEINKGIDRLREAIAIERDHPLAGVWKYHWVYFCTEFATDRLSNADTVRAAIKDLEEASADPANKSRLDDIKRRIGTLRGRLP